MLKMFGDGLWLNNRWNQYRRIFGDKCVIALIVYLQHFLMSISDSDLDAKSDRILGR